MHLLVIGGTVFLGRHLVLEALAAGHKVITLNRGTHNLAEQANVEKLIDDRTRDLEILAGRKFDAVIDTSGYERSVVSHSMQTLATSVDSYVFISSVSAYGTFDKAGLNENDPIKYSTNEAAADPGQLYGMRKADCEKLLAESIPGKALIIRPGLIVGPFDPTERFTYWPARITRGGEVLAPGDQNRPVQFIDVRDLSKWIIKLIERKTTGVFNATGPQDRLNMGEFLQQCKNAISADSTFTWVNDQFLLEHKVQPYVDLPLWIPASLHGYTSFMEIDSQKAFQAGLEIRPLECTIEATLAWHRDRSADANFPGLSADRERDLLDKFKHCLATA